MWDKVLEKFALTQAFPPIRVQRYPLAQAGEAHRMLEARSVIGKQVLVTDFGYSLGR